MYGTTKLALSVPECPLSGGLFHDGHGLISLMNDDRFAQIFVCSSGRDHYRHHRRLRRRAQ